MADAAQILGGDKKRTQLFSCEDPFNPGVSIEGVLSLRPDHNYGSMVILRVDGRRCRQTVRATPKLHYPFDKGGTFRFPVARSIHFYEKLDGTNILSYAYDHPDGRRLVSHKLRLAPFVRNGRWGSFLDMWRELLQSHPQIPGLVLDSGYNFSFEMYGSRNEHLIRYKNSLEVALLFGIGRANGCVAAPHMLDLRGVPAAALLGEVGRGDDPVARYEEMRKFLEGGNSKETDGKISGREGAVWYLRGGGGEVSMWKCKPESVESIHWATGINKASVLATCWNSLESSDALDYGTLEPLLLEEYQQDDILKFRAHIDACIAEVNEENSFRSAVREAYGEIQERGLRLETDKGAVMRILSGKFPRDKMTKVYGAISR